MKRFVIAFLLFSVFFDINIFAITSKDTLVNNFSFRLKTSTLLSGGEIPLFAELRYNKHSIEFFGSYVYLGYLKEKDISLCKGYKFSIGYRKYITKKESNKFEFYFNPQLSYKEIYFDDVPNRNSMLFNTLSYTKYDLKRTVYGVKVNFGWIFQSEKSFFYEIYFGFGYRVKVDYRTPTVWNDSVSTTIELDEPYLKNSPSVHFGLIFGFGL